MKNRATFCVRMFVLVRIFPGKKKKTDSFGSNEIYFFQKFQSVNNPKGKSFHQLQEIQGLNFFFQKIKCGKEKKFFFVNYI